MIVDIVNEIVKMGVNANLKYLDEINLPIDYCAIFSKNESEQELLTNEILKLKGKMVEDTSTGYTYKLPIPISTIAGNLYLIKLRSFDINKQQRGAPDFRIEKYEGFKKTHLGNDRVNLIVRDEFEMLELVGDDILNYFPNKPLSIEVGINLY